MIDIQSIPSTEPIRIIIGAGQQRWPGWIPTQKEELDLLEPEDWESLFVPVWRMHFCVNMYGSI